MLHQLLLIQDDCGQKINCDRPNQLLCSILIAIPTLSSNQAKISYISPLRQNVK